MKAYVMPKSLVKAHRLLAIGLGLFIFSHLAVHITAIGGADLHIATLSNFQIVYRNWLIEPMLYLAILVQVYIGGKLILQRYRQNKKGFWGWAQIISGVYLALFMIMHGVAALLTRHVIGLETNFYWAAGTLNIYPLQYFFTPYYTLGVLSVFVHLGAAIHFGWEQHRAQLSGLLIFVGVVVSGLIVFTFSGGLYDIKLPKDVIESFERYIPS